MTDLVPLVSCPENEIAFATSPSFLRTSGTLTSAPSLNAVQARDETDTQGVPLPANNDTSITEGITRLALEALVLFKLEEERTARSLGNSEAGEFSDGVEAADAENVDQEYEDEAEDDDDEYWGSDRIRQREADREAESDYVEGPLLEDLTNEHPDETENTDDDDDYEDPEVPLSVIQHVPFAERYYGVAGHQREDPDSDDDWSGSDYSSEPDYSEGELSEPGSEDDSKKSNAQSKGSKRFSLFTQYKRIIPPNHFPDRVPPTQFPTEPIYSTPDSFDIPQGIYALVEDIAVDSLLCEVIMARSMMMRVNGYGLKKGELCCIKIYSKDHETAERTRKSNHYLRNEIKAYQRLAEAARRDKPGFLFLMQLGASLQDESRYFLIMASPFFSFLFSSFFLHCSCFTLRSHS